MNRRASILVAVAALAIVGVAGSLRFKGADFHRHLDGDEALSLEHYTWVGLEPDGKQHRVRRIRNYYDRPVPGPTLAGLGLYCSLGRWPEPNNHIVNSLAMNASVAAKPRDERSARLPALVFALAFGLLFISLCGVYLGSPACGLPVLICILWCPYFIQYSQEARGYTAMLALQALQMLVAVRVIRNPSSIVLGSLSATLAILSILNMVNLALDWILPFYLALFLLPSARSPGNPSSLDANFRTLRRNLVIQVLAVGAVGFLFLMTHLPAVISSMRQYGLPFVSIGQLPSMVGRAAWELFPSNAWLCFAFVGLIGLTLFAKNDRPRFPLILAILIVVVGLLHFSITHRMPYTRVLGYVLPLIFLGFANVISLTMGAGGTPRRRALVWAAWFGLSVLLAASTKSTRPATHDLAILLQSAEAIKTPSRPMYSLMTGSLKSEVLNKYLPESWLDEYDDFPARDEVVISIFADGDEGHDVKSEGPAVKGGSPYWDPAAWSNRPAFASSGRFRLFVIPGNAVPLDEEAGDGRALVFWYPDPKFVVVTPHDVIASVDQSGLRYLTQAIRHQVKVDIYGRLQSVILICETPDEYKAARRFVVEKMGEFGGHASVFCPKNLELSGGKPL